MLANQAVPEYASEFHRSQQLPDGPIEKVRADDPATERPEKSFGPDQITEQRVGLEDLLDAVLGTLQFTEGRAVAERMVADTVARLESLYRDGALCGDGKVAPEREEGGLHRVLGEHVQHPGRDLRVGAIVEREGYFHSQRLETSELPAAVGIAGLGYTCTGPHTCPYWRTDLMRLCRFSVRDLPPRPGLVEGDYVLDLSEACAGVPDALTNQLGAWGHLKGRLAGIRDKAARHPLADVRLHAPVARPGKILAIGLNYADHCAESGLAIPQRQTWFSKASSAVNGPFDSIELPWVSEQLDHECELVVVIGRRCRDVPRERAREVTFGYCVGNDVSVRDWQLMTPQWVIGKSFDTHAPIGPWITTTDEVNPGALAIRCLVNGEVRQQSNTRHLVFDVGAQIEHLTKAMTLEPGDLLFTGTCAGVGGACKPPRWLRAGDRVRVEIEQLGAIENTVAPRVRATQIEDAAS